MHFIFNKVGIVILYSRNVVSSGFYGLIFGYRQKEEEEARSISDMDYYGMIMTET